MPPIAIPRVRRATTSGFAALFGLLALAASSACSPWEAGPVVSQPGEPGATGADADPVTLSFAFIGCNRVGWGEIDGHPLPTSTANRPQLVQTFDDIEAHGKAQGREVDYLFLLGDLVRNESSGKTLAQQLADWQTLWQASSLASTSTQMVPLTGNHEVLVSVEYAQGEYYEVPDAGANGAWLRWLNAHRHPPQPGNGPTPESNPSDLLRGDNRQLTYSFDVETSDGKTAHFLLMDTDTNSSFATENSECYQPPRDTVRFHGHPIAGTRGLDVPGWVPLDWIQADLGAARGADYVFALGHKPLLYPKTASVDDLSTGRDSIFNCGRHRQAKALVDSFSTAPNFVAYLTAHQHLWDAFPIQGPGGNFWQIVAGNGGSPLIEGHDTFGFTLVEVYESGKILATRFDRAVPADYYYSPQTQAAQPSRTFAIHR